jgi:hypothetical protein
MIYLNSETLKNIIDSMPQGRITNRTQSGVKRSPSTGLPIAGKMTLRQRFVRLALRRANRGAHVVHKYPGKK